MLVRGVLRLAADGPAKAATHDVPQLARFLQRTLLSRNASNTPAVRALSRAYKTALSDYGRAYATTAQAAKKPTATVKKAVKAQAVKKTPAKKTAAKKTTAAKPKKKKVVAKKTAAKKKVAKKPAPKKRVKKVLDPEAKAKASIAALKKRALREPVSRRPIDAHHVYIAEQLAGQTEKGAGSKAITDRLIEANKKYKALTPAELEHYNHLAQSKNAERQAQYLAWINSYTPAQIADANHARALLRRKTKNTGKGRTYPAHTAKLHDDRHVKTSKTAYICFFSERHASGDLKGIAPTEATKLISSEWKALSEAEKKKYQDEAAADKARHTREVAAQA